MDQYLHWDSHHNISNKYNVLTPSYIGPRLFVQINSYLDKNYDISGLPLVGASTWTGSFTDFKLKMDYQHSLQHDNNNPNNHKDINKTKDIFIVAPYSRGLSESFKNICGKAGVQVHFKDKNNTIKDLLVTPKDKDNITN